MSYGREMVEDSEIDIEVWTWEESKRCDEGNWTQRDGTVINIAKMDDRHIRNCIRMLQRQEEEYGSDDMREEWIERFKEEMERRENIWSALKEVL